MWRLLPLLLPIVFGCLLNAGQKPGSVRVCVATLENTSRQFVNTRWQRDQLVKALERTNKDKDVKNGKALRIEPVALDSSGEPDPAVRDRNCRFVLHTNLTEVLRASQPTISIPPPAAVEVGTSIGDARAYPDGEFHRAVVGFRLLRTGNPEPILENTVSAQDRMSEEALVSQLMDQIANRTAAELRNPHSSGP